MAKKSLSEIMNNLRQASGNEYSSLASEGTIADITSYTDTGCYIWNSQVSGSLFGGLPNGQLCVIAGESTTGKTFFSISLIDNFIKNNDNPIVLIFDSENAINKTRLEARNVDLSKINYYPVTSLFDFKNQIVNVLDTLNEEYKPGDVKILIVLDSLGNLPSTKELNDAKEGKQKVDMTRSKEIRSLFRVVTVKLSKHKIPMIVTNHTYTQINAFFPTQTMSGGGGVKFGSDYIFQLTKAKDKDSKGNVIGNVITSTAVKNRDALENTKVKMMLSYKHGLHPYYGLLPIAEEAGLIVKEGKNYIVAGKSDKPLSEKMLYQKGAEIFTQEFLEKLEPHIKKAFNYGDSAEEAEMFGSTKKADKKKKVVKKKKRKS